MIIEKNRAVAIHYDLYNEAGELVESSKEASPVEYLQGHQNMIMGVEAALEGKLAGDKLEITVEPEQGYGPYQAELKQTVPAEAFGDATELVPGMRFSAETEHGPIPVVITEINDEGVVVDGNHPFAGKTLKFNLEVVSVGEATEEEIAHGHLHRGDHHH